MTFRKFSFSLRNTRPITFEVMHGRTILGPISRQSVMRRLAQGEFQLDDSFRQTGSAEWKTLGELWRRRRLGGALHFVCLALVMIGIGGIILFFGLRILGTDRASLTWPSVAGKITYAAVETYGSGSGRSYAPRISYAYRVAGRTRVGSVIYPGCFDGTKDWAEWMFWRYPVGSTCRVFYSPRNPDDAVLEPGFHRHAYFLTGIGSVFVYGGLCWALLAFKLLKTSRPGLRPLWERVVFCTVFVSWFAAFVAVRWLD
jgi:hypothetical protein